MSKFLGRVTNGTIWLFWGIIFWVVVLFIIFAVITILLIPVSVAVDIGTPYGLLLYIPYWIIFCFAWKSSKEYEIQEKRRPETKEEFLERLDQVKCSHNLEIKYMIEGWELNQDTIKTGENGNGI